MKYFTPERQEYFKKAYGKLKKYKKLTALSIVFSVLASIFEGFSLGTMIPFFQSIIDPSSSAQATIPFLEKFWGHFFTGDKTDIVLKLMFFALGMIVLKSFFTYLKTITISRVSSCIRRDLQYEMFEASSEANLQFANKMKAGNLVTSISIFTKSIVSFYFTLLEMISKVSKIIIYLILLVFVSWKFTLMAIILEAVITIPIKNLFAKVKKVSMQATKESAILHSQLIEKLGNIKSVKIFTAEEYERKNFYQISNSMADLDYKYESYEAIIAPLSEVAVMTALVSIFTFVTKIWGLNITFYVPVLITYFYIFLKMFNEANASLRAVARMFQLMEPYKAYEAIIREAQKEKAWNGNQKITKLEKEIVLKDINLRYEEENNVLESINLVIPKGKITALVGPTGSGKTTLANIISGLIMPTGGQIFVDKTDMKEVNTKTWREHLGYISQDIVIFNDTIANNIAYGCWGANKEDIMRAAKVAQIDDFIETLPQKYETIVGEKGARLSGGQKQRIAIARAIIRDPELLILDEATSSLDTETEKAIQASLEKVLAGKTVVAIAHRLSTIKSADNIVVVVDGKILEQGTHEELLDKKGFYKKYYEQQFKD
ncbi:ABC transporter ATP-binding protein [Candidatus Kuenenbacteria bacterium]|nr:ABC transporter ATP-binding protein [Candidatus Kuenenbacteria bacterium]